MRPIPDFAYLSETFLRHTKSGIKTGIQSKLSEKKKLKFGLKKKLKNCSKKDNLYGILSGTCPLYLEMSRINFNGFLRGLSGIFSQINNFKSLEQNSEKLGI